MMLSRNSVQAARVAAVAVCCLLASGMVDGARAVAATARTVTPINRSATSASIKLQGSPASTATVGSAWSFKPTATGTGNGTRTFSIKHQPAWAKFDTRTGQLSGTPNSTQVGTYSSIAISVTQGKTTAALSAFSVKVIETGSQSNVTLSWQPPSENTDGSALRDLKGYKVHYGATSGKYSQTIQLANAGLTTYVVQNLPVGKYYFSLTAYNTQGQESVLSSEIATQVD